MFDHKKWQAIEERVGTEVSEGAVPPENLGPGTDATWRTWLRATYELQELGIAPAALCDASNEIASGRAEFASAEHHAAQS
jgi:hypothetical protein